MPPRRPSPLRPAKATTVARKRGASRAPAEAARDEWQPGQGTASQSSPKTILSLQRRYGNRAVQGLIQPKLNVGPADDPYEREADRVADQVMAARLAPGQAPGQASASGQAVPASGLARSSAQATHSALGLIQLKRSLVSSKTTTRKFKGPRTDNRDNDVKAVDKAPKGVAFAPTELIDLHEGTHANIADKTGFIAWYRIQSGKGAGEFIRGTKLMGGLQEGETAGEPGAGPSTSFLDQSNVAMGAIDNNLLDYARQVSVEGGNTIKLNLGEGATWAGAGLLGMAVSLRDLADDEKGAWDKVNAFIGLLSGIVSVQGAAAQIVGNAATQGTTLATQASTTSAWLLSYGDMFSSLLNGIRVIRGVIDLVKMVASGEKYNTGKFVQLGTEIVGAGLDTARNVLRSIRLVNEAIAGGTVGTQFGQLVPGLDIAIAAVKSIQQGYYLVVSAVEMQRMYKRKMDLEAKLREAGHSQEDIKATGKRHRTEEAQSVTFSQLIDQVNAKIVSNEAKRDKIKVEGSEEQRRKQTAKREAYDQKIQGLKEKRDSLTERQAELHTRIEAHEGGGGLKRTDLEERELASDTHIANKRRVTRQAVHISTNLVQIGGSIAALVSGPGAPAAVALKLSAAGVDASLPIFRWMKQKGRDMAARNLAKGQTGLANKIFNADKNTAAKQKARHKQAVVILQMVGKLHKLMPGPTDGEEARNEKVTQLRDRARYVEGYIRATGCPPEKLYAANGDPNKQVKILIEELSKREL